MRLPRIATLPSLCYHRADFAGDGGAVPRNNRAVHPCEGPGQNNGRVSVASSTSLTSGVAGRYATALFEIAKESKSLDKLEDDIAAFEAAMGDSPELRGMLASPVFTREDQGRAVAAIANRMEMGPALANTLGLMAQNRRLFVVPAMLVQVKGLIAAERGEVTAEVTTARPLSEAQAESLTRMLKQSVGKDVRLDVTVDESLIGGLVVKVGSRMIDTSIRSKLANLQNVMKEVG
jgi:F-type H+-transporting ATPase subunit delta